MHPHSSPRQEVEETPCAMKDCTKNDIGECVGTEKRRNNCAYLQLREALNRIGHYSEFDPPGFSLSDCRRKMYTMRAIAKVTLEDTQ